jgi:hypothetical protein
MVDGQFIPVSNAGPSGLSGAIGAGSKKYQERYGTRLADMDIQELADIRQMRNNANEIATTGYQAKQLLDKTENLTGPYFKVAQFVGRALPFQDQERLAKMNAFQKLAAQGVLENVKKLPGPLSEKELGFLQTTTYNPEGKPKENQETANERIAIGNKLKKYAQAQQAWIDRFGTTRAKNDRGMSFDDFWDEWSKTLEFKGDSVTLKQGVKPAFGLGAVNRTSTPQAQQPRPQVKPTVTKSGATVSAW